MNIYIFWMASLFHLNFINNTIRSFVCLKSMMFRKYFQVQQHVPTSQKQQVDCLWYKYVNLPSISVRYYNIIYTESRDQLLVDSMR